jgi:hypothetical protein
MVLVQQQMQRQQQQIWRLRWQRTAKGSLLQ